MSANGPEYVYVEIARCKDNSIIVMEFGPDEAAARRELAHDRERGRAACIVRLDASVLLPRPVAAPPLAGIEVIR